LLCAHAAALEGHPLRPTADSLILRTQARGSILLTPHAWSLLTPASPERVPSQASIATPVVDSSRLARYGLLAPPAYVPPASSDRPVQYDRNAGVIAHNRGALREAVAQKTGGLCGWGPGCGAACARLALPGAAHGWQQRAMAGLGDYRPLSLRSRASALPPNPCPPHHPGHIEDAPVRKWAEFTARQRARHVPVPPDGQRRMLPATQGGVWGGASGGAVCSAGSWGVA